MRKTIATIAMLALMAAPAVAADVTTDSAQADVTLTIEKYCEIGYDATSFDITLTGGASGGSDTEAYSAGANFAATITGALTPPTAAPGDWSYEIDGGASVGFGPGTHTGNAIVEVANVGLGDGTFSASDGTMVLTISE